MTDKEKVKEKRKNILSKSAKTTVIKKGDKRVSSSTRIWAVCGKPLSSLVLRTGASITTANHMSCLISGFVRLNICEDIRSCYAYSNKKGGTQQNEYGRQT